MNKPSDEKPELEVVVEEEIVPIVEERIRLDKRTREGRSVIVRSKPVTESVTLTAPVTREHVAVRRVPIGRIVEDVPPVREEGDLTIIPVVEERLRVVVDLVLSEEIHLERTSQTVEETFTAERRRTEIEIEERDGTGSA